MSSSIKKPNTIYPTQPQSSSVNPNYDKLIHIPQHSQHTSLDISHKKYNEEPKDKSSSSDVKEQMIRLVIVIFMLSIIGIIISFISTAKKVSSFNSKQTFQFNNNKNI